MFHITLCSMLQRSDNMILHNRISGLRQAQAKWRYQKAAKKWCGRKRQSLCSDYMAVQSILLLSIDFMTFHYDLCKSRLCSTMYNH